MKGLELSRLYYEEIFLPQCKMRVPDAIGHFAAGLAGEGSECFGYDDKLSQDHSFGPRLCIWLTREDYVRYGEDLNLLWNNIPETFMGYKRPPADINEGKRSGIFTIGEFYNRLLGVSDAPEELSRWLTIDEPSLAAATNGEVFYDAPGKFTAVRKKLLDYYPDDIAKYYLAKHAAGAAQTGQYNLLRAYCHGEKLAAENIKSQFIHSVIAMVFLLNKVYRPFYKWAPKAMRSLPVFGRQMHDMLLALTKACDINEQITLVEDICRIILTEMRTQEYTNGQSDYLMDHIPEIINKIESVEIRNRGISLTF